MLARLQIDHAMTGNGALYPMCLSGVFTGA